MRLGWPWFYLNLYVLGASFIFCFDSIYVCLFQLLSKL